jgi:sugar phosphate isomerase/epimerase
MRLSDGSHLTYCGNVHPAQSLGDVRKNVEAHVAEVKARVSPKAPFGVGLWLPSEAVAALATREARWDFAAWLRALGLYAFTFNAFPYGAFHGEAVKEKVYEPDWRDPRRLRYSLAVAELLAELLPDGVDGSVSTVPGAFRRAVHGQGDVRVIAEALLATALQLHRVRERTGKRITLALEPEPFGMLETIDEAVTFFERELRSERAIARVAELSGLSRARAAQVVAEHLGLCLDACHAAVEFEDPLDALDRLWAAQIPVAKLQLSSALRIESVGAETAALLRPYLDPVYLHQVVERRGSRLTRYLDLPDALAALAQRCGEPDPCEWRVHFHVPVFLEHMRGVGSTQAFLRELIAAQRSRPFTRHLEVETYTWAVLPPEVADMPLADGIARELAFALAELGLEAA